jgi:hypothetical protein
MSNAPIIVISASTPGDTELVGVDLVEADALVALVKLVRLIADPSTNLDKGAAERLEELQAAAQLLVDNLLPNFGGFVAASTGRLDAEELMAAIKTARTQFNDAATALTLSLISSP